MKIETNDFGLGATLITLTNSSGLSVSFTNFGARIVRLNVPSKTGTKNIIWGYKSTSEYLSIDSFPGASIGRFAGRIRSGEFTISDKEYKLNQNDGSNTLHGGSRSFDTRLWLFEVFEEKEKAGVHFYLVSNDGENGFPGELNLEVTHTFDEEGNWTVSYTAQSTKDTLFNPTNHVYFNLTGDLLKPIDDHQLALKADSFALLDEENLPTGSKEKLVGGKLDFTHGKRVGDAINSDHPQVIMKHGIDHPFFLAQPSLTEAQAILTLDDIKVSVFTDRPAIVIFTVNFDKKLLEHYRGTLGFHGGITFETQVAPGSTEFNDFGNPYLLANQTFKSTTIYKIEVENDYEKGFQTN